jgi:PAS domain S-box-containing protein
VRRWVVVGAGLIALAYFASISARLLEGDRYWIGTEYVALAGAVVGMVLALGGRVRAGGLFVMGVVWAELHSSMMVADGPIGTAGWPVFPALIVGTGLFLGSRSAIVLAVVTSATIPGCIVVAQALGSHTSLPSNGFYHRVVLDATMVVTAFMVHEGLVAFQQVFAAQVAHERKFSLLVRHAPDGIVLLDQAGRIESFNPAAERLLGIAEADARHRYFRDIIGPAVQQIGSLLPLPDGDRPITGEMTILDDNQQRLLEVSASRTVLTDGSAGAQMVLRDLTDRREMERHVMQLGRMLDQALSEMFVFDAETLRLRFVNLGARRNLGYEPAEVDRLTITDVAPALTHAYVRQLMTDLTARPDAVVALRGQHRRKDGSAYPVEARLHLVAFADQSAVGLFALDVSARPASAPPPEPTAG